jgi:phosphopantethiene--protein transferase domain
MIKGIGVDLVKISRLDSLSDYQKMRMFSAEERAEAETLAPCKQSEYYASRFAAKEAFSKALGISLFTFRLTDIAIVRNGAGAPEFLLSGSAAEKAESCNLFLSISHEKEYAVAMVVCDAQ